MTGPCCEHHVLAHQHLRHGSECALCGCVRFNATGRRERRLARTFAAFGLLSLLLSWAYLQLHPVAALILIVNGCGALLVALLVHPTHYATERVDAPGPGRRT